MKKLLKIFGILLLIIIIGVAGLLIYVKTALPNVGPPPELSIEITPERLQRGEYLANHVNLCMDCHSTRDWGKYAGPPKPGTAGIGGEIFDQQFGFPGAYYARNITPAGVGDWTDGELFRAITAGVSKDGSALFPVMPHPNYGRMDEEDIYSIIAYIRSLPSIESEIPASSSDFPMNFIINLIPQKPSFQKIPDQTNLVEYGEYVFNAAACRECHTQQVQGQAVVELDLAGGFEFQMPGPSSGVVRSTNITQDKKTGIGNWTEEMFGNRFKAYTDSTYQNPTISSGEFNTVMPWLMYAGMDTVDLKAIFAYLQTVEPIEYEVERWSPEG